MDLKLQQAIVATRAGRSDVAQHLLTQLIHEKPDDAHAWFLLGHIVDSKDRQISYLQKAVDLDPNNSLAKNQVVQLTAPLVPAAVIAREEAQELVQKKSMDPEPIQEVPAKTPSMDLNEYKTPTNLRNQSKDPANQQAVNNNGDEWSIAAGTPKREIKDSIKITRILHIPQDTSRAKSASDRTPEEIWLLRILAGLVVLAAIVLGVLVLLILF